MPARTPFLRLEDNEPVELLIRRFPPPAPGEQDWRTAVPKLREGRSGQYHEWSLDCEVLTDANTSSGQVQPGTHVTWTPSQTAWDQIVDLDLDKNTPVHVVKKLVDGRARIVVTLATPEPPRGQSAAAIQARPRNVAKPEEDAKTRLNALLAAFTFLTKGGVPADQAASLTATWAIGCREVGVRIGSILEPVPVRLGPDDEAETIRPHDADDDDGLDSRE
jgi:hypothetical protein